MAKKSKNILLLTYVHNSVEISSGFKSKPIIILDYNRGKAGVDLLDELVG